MSSERSFISSPNASNKMSLTSAASRSSFSELSSDDLPGTPVLPDPPSHFHKKFPVNTALRGLASESQVIFFQKLDEKINAGAEFAKAKT